MPSSPQYCDVGLSRADTATVISVTGEIDLFTAPALAEAVRQATHTAAPIVIDLSGCTFFDSNGLHVLLHAHLAAQRSGRKVVIASPPESPAARVLAVAAPGQLPEHASARHALAAL